MHSPLTKLSHYTHSITHMDQPTCTINPLSTQTKLFYTHAHMPLHVPLIMLPCWCKLKVESLHFHGDLDAHIGDLRAADRKPGNRMCEVEMGEIC